MLLCIARKFMFLRHSKHSPTVYPFPNPLIWPRVRKVRPRNIFICLHVSVKEALQAPYTGSALYKVRGVHTGLVYTGGSLKAACKP